MDFASQALLGLVSGVKEGPQFFSCLDNQFSQRHWLHSPAPQATSYESDISVLWCPCRDPPVCATVLCACCRTSTALPELPKLDVWGEQVLPTLFSSELCQYSWSLIFCIKFIVYTISYVSILKIVYVLFYNSHYKNYIQKSVNKSIKSGWKMPYTHAYSHLFWHSSCTCFQFLVYWGEKYSRYDEVLQVNMSFL